MVRLNLQLFAVATSIVDYLKSQGQDSSFSARKQLAQQYGISNYSGTAQQNTQLLKTLQSGTKPTTSSTPTTPSNTNTTSTQSKLNGVDQSTYDRMNSQFQVSSAYQDAMAKVQSLLDQISSGKTSYTDQVKGLMDKIQNREEFSYDMDSDVMFQQYLSSMMASGKTAMQDTMGQAVALTGGYGSSYAQSVGNQAYNSFVKGAYDQVPEFYNMALQTYQMEGDELYKQYSMLSEADAQEYARLVDSWNMNNTNAQQMYSQEYQKWADDVANATNLAGLQNSDWWNNKNYEESVRQFDKNYSLQQQQLALQKSQASKSGSSSKTISGGSPKLEKPDQAMYEEALKRYAVNGMDGLNAYLNSLPDHINKNLLAEHVGAYGKQLPSQWDVLKFK
jgi:hypothetical protein